VLARGLASAGSGAIFPAIAAPSPRFGAAISLFLNGSQFGVVLFGGTDLTINVSALSGPPPPPAPPPPNPPSPYVLFNDTWQFNVGTHTWWNVTPHLHCGATVGCPAPRFEASMAYDYGDGYAVLFGGCANSSAAGNVPTPCPGNKQSVIYRDTWSYSDPAGGVGQWTQIHTAHTPEGRFGASLAYDETDGYLLLFGGCGSPCPMGNNNSQMWSYSEVNSGGWVVEPTYQNGPTPPSPRFGAAMADDGPTEGVILFGGCNSVVIGCNYGRGVLGDTWEWANGGWFRLQNPHSPGACTPSDPCPPARFDAGVTSYSGPSSNESLLLFGGVGARDQVLGNASSDAGGWWSFSAATGEWSESNAPPGFGGNGSGWDGSVAPGHLVGAWGAPAPPAPRYLPALEGTPYGGLLLFGGASPLGSALGDTWGASPLASPPQYLPYSGLISPFNAPAPASGASAVYDPADGDSILFGGCAANCTNGSTWSFAPYSAATRQQPWEPVVFPAGAALPTPRTEADMVYVPTEGGSVLLFGGLTTSAGLLNDLWQYAGGRWNPVDVLGTSPPARSGGSMAYDEQAGEVVLFGGTGSGGPLGDTWLLSFLPFTSAWSWIHLLPTPAPAARYGAAMTYDASGGVVMMFGGCGSTCPLNDTWLFDGSAWSRCNSTGCTTNAPTARWGAALAYDPSTGTDVMFGGCGRLCPIGDTWEYSSSSGWYELSPAKAPEPRYDAAMEFDGNAGAMLLWGGVGDGGELLGGDGWILTGGNWYTGGTPVYDHTEYSPTPGFAVSMVYDNRSGVVFLVSGCSWTLRLGECDSRDSGLSTWRFSNNSWSLVCGPGGNDCAPSSRFGYSLAYDPDDNYVVLFGGCLDSGVSPGGACSSLTNDTWTFSPDGGAWTQLTENTSPAQRLDAPMAWSAILGAGVLYGGWGPNHAGPKSVSPVLNDTWTFSKGKWTQFLRPGCVPGVCAPPALYGASMVADPDRGGMVLLYGGHSTTGVSDQLWSFFPQVGWISLGNGPVGVYDAAAGYDVNEHELVLVGGIAFGSSGGFGPSPTILFWSNNQGSWSIGSTNSSVGGLWGAAGVYDPNAGAAGLMLVYGGSRGSTFLIPSPFGIGVGEGETWGCFDEAGACYDLTPFA
jgi:hypothetical protein